MGCLCPFHGEKTPSFTVSPTKQFYHCFGCGAHGTAIGFLMEYQGLGFVEAVEDLAKRVGVQVPQEARDVATTTRVEPNLYETLQQASAFYRAELKKSERAVAYLKGRGLSGEIAARFQMGYAPAGWQNLREVFPSYESEMLATVGLTIRNDEGRVYDRFRDRVMFPIHNQRGQVIGFGGRVMGGEGDDGPKYLNSPETPLFQKGQELYGLFLARQAIRAAGRVVVVEGYMDVAALAQHGIEYAVATLGTATTPLHIAKLTRQTDDIVFCFDGDAAGRKAAWRAAMNALPAVTDGLRLSFLFLPPEHDPDTYVREFGREGFEAALKGALPLSAYLTKELLEQEDINTDEGKSRFLQLAKPILKEVRAPTLGLLLRMRIADLVGISLQSLESSLGLRLETGTKRKPESRVPRVMPAFSRRVLRPLLFHPQLGMGVDTSLIPRKTAWDELLRQALQEIHLFPSIGCAHLLESLRSLANEKLLAEISAEIIEFIGTGDSFDVDREFSDAIKQLESAGRNEQLKELLALAQDRGLAALTPEQREQLQQFRRNIVS